jgi:hypothetical protein
MDLKETGYEDENWICLVKERPRIVGAPCRYCNESSGSVKGAEVLDQLSDC